MSKKKLLLLGIIFILIFFSFIFVKINSKLKNNVISYDNVNSFSVFSDQYVAVGSNNNNDYQYKKAKLTVYDSSNEKVLEKIYNKGYKSVFYDVIGVEDGYISVGSYESTKKELKSGSQTALIVKYDSTGNIVFENDYGVLGNSKYKSITSYNTFIFVCGSIQSSKNKLESGMFVQYDKDGKELKRISGAERNIVIYNDMLVVNDSIFIVGLDRENRGVIEKFDLEGNLIDSSYYDSVESIGFTSLTYLDNSIYVTTSKYENGKKIAALLKYDMDLNLENEAIYSILEDTVYTNVVVDTNKNIVTIGTMVEQKKKNSKLVGIIGKYNSNLKELSVVKYATDQEILFRDIHNLNDKYLVVGDSIKEDKSIQSKFVTFSSSLKVLEVS